MTRTQRFLWLNRTLLLGPRLAFVTSDAEFQKAKRTAGITCSDPWVEPNWQAATHAYMGRDSQLVCIVALRLEAAARMTGIEVAALLAHEAVHVWQYTSRFIGGDDQGMEMAAYAVQNIVAQLMTAYVAAARRRR